MAMADATGWPPSGRLLLDGCWALILFSVLGFLVLHNFVRGGGPVPELRLGPLRLSTFGLLASLGLLFGVYLVRRWCLRFGLDWQTLGGELAWILCLGWVFAHLVSVVVYFPAKLFDPSVVFDLTAGISIFGLMFGGALVAFFLLRRRGLPVWRYADPLAYGLVGGSIFGRAGCFAIHDHPGGASDFFLAVEIGGIRRHALGFYEIWLMLALFVAITAWARHRRPPDGSVLALAATVYAPARFLLDFLRIRDVTYAGLTPGQWFAFPLFAGGVWVFIEIIHGNGADLPSPCTPGHSRTSSTATSPPRRGSLRRPPQGPLPGGSDRPRCE